MNIRVLTFSVDRPELLARCICSVLAQRGCVPIRQRVLSERVEQLRNHPALAEVAARVEWMRIPGAPFVGDPSSRMSRLRQWALDAVEEESIAFLDDDNAIEPDHFARLGRCLDRDVDAVYSWRRLELPNGSSFDGTWYPWHPNPERARSLHAWCVRAGVLSLGSDVVRDGPVDDPSPENVATVDMNEWLFRTRVLKRIGFECSFSPDEVANQVGEDDKLLARLRAAGIRLRCSHAPTVVYRLGGVSNCTRYQTDTVQETPT